nr:MAG TPA: hypothetical protein [Caudoviricetes sp.]
MKKRGQCQPTESLLILKRVYPLYIGRKGRPRIERLLFGGM